MRPIAFFELAQWLLANKKCPEGYRTSASRAYYGAFHCALDLLAAMKVVVPGTDNKHAKVPDLLDHTTDTAVRKAGSMLGNLREERNNADYKIDKAEYETENFAKQREKEASEIIAALSACKLSKGIAGGRFEAVERDVNRRADLLFRGIRSANPAS